MTCIIGKQQSSISSCGSIKKSTVTLIGSGIPHNQLELQISLSEYKWLVLETFNHKVEDGEELKTTAPKNFSLRKKR